MSSFWEDHMNKYIRNESMYPNIYNVDNVRNKDTTEYSGEVQTNKHSTEYQSIYTKTPPENMNPDFIFTKKMC